MLREYRPDYGLDYSLEIFRDSSGTDQHCQTYETLGEHLFIQLKTVADPKVAPLKVFRRHNVEKARESLDKNELVGEPETFRIQIERSELVTIERMGVGVPVLLVLANLADKHCYFVCLNDYIDKILIPQYEDYTAKESRTIHIPKANVVGGERTGVVALRWYSQRPKLYAAFQRIAYQYAELQYAWNTPQFRGAARYFALRIARYDFWRDTEVWKLIRYYGLRLEEFLETGRPNLLAHQDEAFASLSENDGAEWGEIKELLETEEILELWRLLTMLARNYEDVCREWFLPTALGLWTDTPRAPQTAADASKSRERNEGRGGQVS